ncbi:hypothetical protein PSEUDO8Z_160371 [Pseudomonas sp. 8Z]|uniref:hypothetical protein n=1 Tax=Pseudomonas sp. 8Z TaxID=2653166 RepID=UPI0012F3A80C|nr:hypothetical protein [Pseudomonas sp. 8Z]VXC72884.1 hypothetical protein PSEUDO8Z_160371 [Pseudomonas sp. 8Z]
MFASLSTSQRFYVALIVVLLALAVLLQHRVRDLFWDAPVVSKEVFVERFSELRELTHDNVDRQRRSVDAQPLRGQWLREGGDAKVQRLQDLPVPVAEKVLVLRF